MQLKGSKLFRYKVALSVLLGQDLSLTKIRSKSDHPGIKDYEFNFLQLIELLTNGTSIDVSPTGTTVTLSPGIIINNPTLDTLKFDCGTARAMGYFLEGILPIVLFGKNPLSLIFTGLANSEIDVSVDTIQAVYLPLIKQYGAEHIELKIFSRSQVQLKLTPVRQLNYVELVTPGKIKRVRGTAYSSRISVQSANRAGYTAKGFLHSFLPDVWIHTDHFKSETPLLGLNLVAEGQQGGVWSAEFLRGEASTIEDYESEVPEDLAHLTCVHLLDEVLYGGFSDTSSQGILLLLTSLSVGGTVLFGRISQNSIELMRLIKQLTKIEFEFAAPEEEEEGAEYEEVLLEDPLKENLPTQILAKCTGLALLNIARKSA